VIEGVIWLSEVENKEIGAGIGKSGIEKLVPGWGWRRDTQVGLVDYRDKVKHDEMIDELFLERMMLAAEQE